MRFAARLTFLTAAVLSAALSAGCEALAAPFLMWGPEPTKSVPAEYPYLPEKRVAIIVWVDNHTLFEYPDVRLELAEHVLAEMKDKVKGAKWVPNRDVIEYQERDIDWDRKHPCRLGQRFKADRVLMIEVSQYTTREPDSPHLLRGRIEANVKVYDASVDDSAPTYKTLIEATYPEGNMPEYGTKESVVRRFTMEAFARDLTNRFYDRKVKVK